MLYRIDQFYNPFSSNWGRVEAETPEEAVRLLVSVAIQTDGVPWTVEDAQKDLQNGTIHVCPADELDNEEDWGEVITAEDLEGSTLLEFDTTGLVVHEQNIKDEYGGTNASPDGDDAFDALLGALA